VGKIPFSHNPARKCDVSSRQKYLNTFSTNIPMKTKMSWKENRGGGEIYRETTGKKCTLILE
jgi:hypothetical protein